MTVKSRCIPTQYQSTSNPTSFMGTTEFSNWEYKGLSVWFNHQLVILRPVQNIIYLSVNTPDIAESTLKCIVTETSISFHAYAREHVIHFNIAPLLISVVFQRIWRAWICLEPGFLCRCDSRSKHYIFSAPFILLNINHRQSLRFLLNIRGLKDSNIYKIAKIYGYLY